MPYHLAIPLCMWHPFNLWYQESNRQPWGIEPRPWVPAGPAACTLEHSSARRAGLLRPALMEPGASCHQIPPVCPRLFPTWRGDSTVLLLCALMKHDPTETSCQDPRGGAAGQDRTGDLRLTKSPLYHLSYGSMLPGSPGRQYLEY